MPGYRKLGRTSPQRKAMLRNLATNLIYHEKIRTTETRAKEVRKIVEKLITIAVKEQDNFTEEKITVRVPQKNSKGARVKKNVNGKRVTVYNEVERTVRKDSPSRLSARRKIYGVLYPVTEVPKDGKKKRTLSKDIDLADKLFSSIAPKYSSRPGGYTRMTKLGMRKGDAAEMVQIELV